MSSNINWYDNPTRVNELARHLVDNGTLDTIEDVLYFYERPDKYTREYATFLASKVTK